MRKIKNIILSFLCTVGCTHQITTRTSIEASKSDVWDQLTQTENYPEWNPFILKVKGNLKTGEQIKVTVKPVGGKPTNFTPKVVSVLPQKKLGWQGRVLMPGIFTGHHEFILEEKDGVTEFVQKENFSGILVPFINLSGTKEGFKLMNQALKKRLESKNKGA